jgi:uncharacterized membrane protein YccC
MRAFLVGVACSVGLAIGIALRLPRDYWVLLIIIITLRSTVSSTATSTLAVFIGTLGSGLIAVALILGIYNSYFLGVTLLLVMIGMFSLRGANTILSQLFIVPLIIILLGIISAGQSELLIGARILDVAIGGGIAIVTTILIRAGLGLRLHSKDPTSFG